MEMNTRHISTDSCNEKSDSLSESIIGGFHYFQSSVCSYNACICSSSHYHCQACGYGTSELPHAVVHKESCSRVVRGRFSQSPSSQQPLVTSQASELSLCTSSYDPVPESTMATMSVSSVQSSMQISNTGNHMYYRGGSQQSSVFNPLLSSQSQTLYSGVFGSQVGFPSQNNYPSTFNGYSHVEPPPWLSDTRIGSSTNSTPSLDTGRTSKSLSCSSQGVSHSCCGSRVGLLESIGLCSPLPADSYKPLSKEPASCQHKNAISMENQNWFCGQGMLGYNNQTSSQGIQNSMYKCTDPFPSCTMSQLGIPLNEQGDVKQTGISDGNNISKQCTSYYNSLRKSGCVDVNKDPSTKYNSPQKFFGNGQLLDPNSQCMVQKEQENNVYDSHPILMDGDLHEDIYSQGSVALPDDRMSSLSYNQMSKNAFPPTNILESSKNFTAQQCQTSSLSRCGLSCEVLEGCLQLEGQPLYQYNQLTGTSSNLDDERVSNPGSCSGAAESDIVVEESEEEEVIESEVSVEDGKGSSQTSCLVCNASNACFVHVSVISPVTSTSHIPVATKLAQLMASDSSPSMSFNNQIICRRCLNLVETVDSLESKLASVKQNLIELYKGRVESIKLSEVCAKNIYENTSPDIQESTQRSILSVPKSDSDKDSCAEQKELLEPERLPEKPADEIIDEPLDNQPAAVVEDAPCVSNTEEVKENSEGKFVCNICKKPLASKEYLNKHVQQHTKAYSFFCDRCGRGFMLRAGLEKHLLTHAQEYRFQCEVCGKCFIQNHALKDHLQKHKGAFRLSCSHCKKGFMYASSLRVHERIHTGERPYVCQHCGKSFICASNLTAHVRVCSGERRFSCEYCDRRFATSLQLKSHTVTSHNTGVPLKCEVCGKCFVKQCDLKVHARSHSGEKPHRCEVCGKCYSSVGNLNQHAKKHSAEKPFVCDLCGRGFLRKSVLERHTNQHTGKRPYRCSYCNKDFASARDLHSHSKLHTGTMKQYTCPVCGKSMNNGLKVHMRTHSGDRPYSCSECQASFSVKSTLDKHMKLKHKRVS